VAAPVQDGPGVTAVAAYLWHGQFLSRNRTCEAMAIWLLIDQLAPEE
jgi:hypothetical protein